MITVKMLKDILNKLPDDAIIASGNNSGSHITDLTSVTLNDMTFKNEDNEVLNKKVVYFVFKDLANFLADRFMTSKSDKNYLCSPSVFVKKIENNTNTIDDIYNLDFHKYKNIYGEPCEPCEICEDDSNYRTYKKYKTDNNIDKIFNKVLLSKLKDNIIGLKTIYQSMIKSEIKYDSIKNKIRLLLYKE